jgi:NAD(P)-dependent dehydrogenase (short-subunit alcohol dehydrogenase family)
VNAVSGGPVDTAGVKLVPNYEMKRRETTRVTPAGRVASVADIANVVAFLCKKESSWIRGQTLVADGGLSLKVLAL